MYEVQDHQHEGLVNEELPAHRKHGHQRANVSGDLNEQVGVIGEAVCKRFGIVGHATDEDRIAVRVHAGGLNAEHVVDQVILNAREHMTRNFVIQPFR